MSQILIILRMVSISMEMNRAGARGHLRRGRRSLRPHGCDLKGAEKFPNYLPPRLASGRIWNPSYRH